MDFGATLKNPWVWGGGAVIGAVLLLRSGPANAAAASRMDAANPTYMSSAVAMNAAAMGTQVQLAQISANLGATAFQADTAKQLGFYSLIKAIDDNNAIIENNRVSSEAGITNNLITSSTAIIVDQANNANRLALAYETTTQSEIQANKDVSVAKLQADAQKAVSHNSMIGSIVGGFTNVLAHTLPLALGG